jgi:hypothetical protein
MSFQDKVPAPLAERIATARERGLMLYLPFLSTSFLPDELVDLIEGGGLHTAFQNPSKYRLVTPAKAREILVDRLDKEQSEAEGVIRHAEERVLNHDRRIRAWRAAGRPLRDS